MEERKEIDIPAIFEKIKELDNEKKMQQMYLLKTCKLHKG